VISNTERGNIQVVCATARAPDARVGTPGLIDLKLRPQRHIGICKDSYAQTSNISAYAAIAALVETIATKCGGARADQYIWLSAADAKVVQDLPRGRSPRG
jgi:hypothetical protein